MDILSLVIGLALGVLIGWLLGNKNAKPTGLSEAEVAANFVAKERFNDTQKRLDQEIENTKAAAQTNADLNAQLAAWREKHTHLEEKLSSQKEEINELQERFKNEFKVLAAEILEKNSHTFKEQNKEQIGTILSPLKEKLEQFEKKVEETYDREQKERVSLKTEVKGLMRLNEQLSLEAKNLTAALKGDAKMQGNWGEVILERVLEKSGLEKDREYFVQQSLVGDDGRRYQPDVVLKLPDDKNIIIDSKVSLVAYERFFAAENADEKQRHLKQHVASIKNHVKGLSDKNYQSLYGIDGLDFVLLFVPIEGAFSAALTADNNLFQEAFDRNVVIVSTSTLLATLRTIASIWKQEKQSQNTLEIARQATNLYDKFVNFSEDLLALGKQMNSAKKSYDAAMNKLVDGRGNLVSRVENLRSLGVKSGLTIDDKLLDRAEMNQNHENEA